MAGISRIQITDVINGAGSWRFKDSQKCWTEANKLYRGVFRDIGLELEPGEELKPYSKSEVEAGLDYLLGVDVILKTLSGQTMTMQEKFLFTTFDTVTVEYYQDWRSKIRGDWFNMKCQYYFVGYDYNKKGTFNTWILLDWLRVQLATGQNKIKWWERPNNHDGAKASFRYVKFDFMPDEVVIARSKTKTMQAMEF